MIKLHNSVTNIVKCAATTGSYLGMRYRIHSPDKESMIVCLYPEPFCYESTLDQDKITKDFPLSDAGLVAAQDWMNEMYQIKSSHWKDTASTHST